MREDILSLSPSMASYLAYSEWRPTRWRLRLSTGRSYGLFTSHEKAVVFADGVLMSFDDEDDVEAIITRVPQAAHLVWKGDDIGCGDGPAVIHFEDDFGIDRYLSVADCLQSAGWIDGYGLTRIVSALRCCAEYLHPADREVWLKHEADYPVRTGGVAL